MIGSLRYLIASKLDLCYSVRICARYEACPKESHLSVVKKMIKYVSGTTEFKLWYSHDSSITLMGYCDAYWVGNSDDRKSTSRRCFFLGNNLVSWFSKKHNSISVSTTEAEYIVIGSSCSQLIWMQSLLQDYGVLKDAAAPGMTLYCDNLNAINISKNLV